MDITGAGSGSAACPPIPNTVAIPGAADAHTLANMLQERFLFEAIIPDSRMVRITTCCPIALRKCR